MIRIKFKPNAIFLTLLSVLLISCIAANESYAESSQDTRLAAIYLNEIPSFSSGFDPEKHTYTVNVPTWYSSITVSAVPIDKNASVFINGTQTTSKTLPLTTGTNSIQVTAQIEKSEENYIILINREQADNATLFGLNLSNLTLDKPFNTEQTTYYAWANDNINYTSVTPLASSGTNVSINGYTVKSGDSQLIPLSNGATVISVVATSQNGKSKNYTIYINKSSTSADAELKSVSINGIDFPINNSNASIIGYVPAGVSAANVTIIPTSSSATVKIDGNEVRFSDNNTINIYIDNKQSNQFTITVTSSNGRVRNYYLNIIKDSSKANGSTGSTQVNSKSEAELDKNNGIITVTEGKGAVSTTQKGSNGSSIFNVKLGDPLLIKSIEQMSNLSLLKVDYSNLMGFDDVINVNFSKELIDVIRGKEIEIQISSENASVSLSTEMLEEGIYMDSSLSLGRVIATNKFGAEYTPVTSAIKISATGAFPSRTNKKGAYTLEMKISVSTGDNRRSNVYKETDTGWSVVSSQTIQKIKKVRFVSVGNYIIMDYVKHFIDIKKHWASNLVDFMSKKQIVDGYSNNTFRPDQYISRSEFTTMLVRVMSDKGLKTMREAPAFTDVQWNSWDYNYISEGYQLGLVLGLTPEKFEPTRSITREEMAAISVRAMILLKGKADGFSTEEVKTVLNRFVDQKEIANWSRAELAYAVKEKIIDGVVNNRMDPKSNATRAQAAVVLYKILEATNNL